MGVSSNPSRLHQSPSRTRSTTMPSAHKFSAHWRVRDRIWRQCMSQDARQRARVVSRRRAHLAWRHMSLIGPSPAIPGSSRRKRPRPWQ